LSFTSSLLTVSRRATARCQTVAVCALLAGCPARQQPTGGPPPHAEASAVGASSPDAAAAVPPAEAGVAGQERRDERERMVREDIEERQVKDPRVLAAMRRVPRHRFVPPEARALAYEDHPLSIGEGQTISQPYIVAFMTEAARPGPQDKCLEIGTGSGYQAAVLAELCNRTFSIEYLPKVARMGERNLRRLGYLPPKVTLRVGDGYRGWPEQAPFNVILVTAAPEAVPPPLLEQLAIGGRLIIPIGPQDAVQELERWTRLRGGTARASFRVERLMAVRFVPFLGEGAAE
jgi:protein-L-isoaspartate(D-aspartate) O-methyltransferase